MERRILGKTGLSLPVISFGASSLGHAFRPVGVDDALRCVREALDLGIDHFDTSPFYGRGISEVLLGIALRDVPRDRYTLSTKLGRYDVDRFDFRAARVVESVDRSLYRLGIEHADIVFCHDIEFVDLRQIFDETLPALRALQRQGKVRLVGVAGYPMKMFERVLDHADVDVILSYGHYTLQNRRLEALLPRLTSRGVGVLNAAPFAQRLLTDKPLPEWHESSPALRAACRRAAEHCAARGVDIAKLAVQFAVRHPDLSTCVIGSGDPASIRRWARWLDEPYEAKLVAEVEQILAPVRDESWTYGLPENN
jgi:aryl-alcohol dehydrogenase-like predicted oxidoreductase